MRIKEDNTFVIYVLCVILLHSSRGAKTFYFRFFPLKKKKKKKKKEEEEEEEEEAVSYTHLTLPTRR